MGDGCVRNLAVQKNILYHTDFCLETGRSLDYSEEYDYNERHVLSVYLIKFNERQMRLMCVTVSIAVKPKSAKFKGGKS